jgi:hypothetical protein
VHEPIFVQVEGGVATPVHESTVSVPVSACVPGQPHWLALHATVLETVSVSIVGVHAPPPPAVELVPVVEPVLVVGSVVVVVGSVAAVVVA